MSSQSRIEVGFLGFEVRSEPKLLLRGGCLVTDRYGDPLEFQAAAAVRPSRVQRALWAGGLTRYAIVELLGRPLLQALEHRPLLVFTNRMEALALESRAPLLHLNGQGSAPDPDLPHRTRSFAGRQRCLTLPRGRAALPIDKVLSVLDILDGRFDPFDVFTRISVALEALAEDDARYA